MAISSFSRSGLARVVSLPAANFSNTATGTYTDGNGVSWKYVSFTGNGTLTITEPGLADILLVGAGGGSGGAARGGGGGGGAVISLEQKYLAADTYTVTVGGGGAGTSSYAGATASSGTESSMLGVFSIKALGGGGGGGGAQPGYSTAATGRGAGDGNVASAGGNNGYTSSTILGVSGLGNSNGGGSQGGGTGGAGTGSTTPTNGVNSDITGTTVMYGKGGPRWASDFGAVTGDPDIGQGGFGNAAEAGANGIVVIRVRV